MSWKTKHGLLGDDYGLGVFPVDEINAILGKVADALWSKIQQKMDDKFAELRAQVLAAVQGAIDKITAYVAAGVKSITDLASKIQATVEEAMDTVRNAMDNFSKAAVSALTSLENTMKKAVSDLQSQLTAFGTKLTQDMRTAMNDIGATIKKDIGDQLTNVTNAMKIEINKNIKDQLDTTTKDLQARITSLVKDEVARIPKVAAEEVVKALKEGGYVSQAAGGFKWPSFGADESYRESALQSAARRIQQHGFFGQPLSGEDALEIAGGIMGMPLGRRAAVACGFSDDRII